MFGLFKKKQVSKTVQKSKPIQKQHEKGKFQSSSKNQKNKNQKKQSQKLIPFNRQETQGQFIQKKKIKKPSQGLKKQQKSSINIQTPKIQIKKNLKEIQQKDTQRPHKISTQANDINPKKKNQEQKLFMRENNYQYEDVKNKEVISLKLIKKLLEQLNNICENQNQILISKQLGKNKSLKDVHIKLFYSKYFRFHQLKNINDVIQRYGQILQGFQLLISKLNNRIGKGVHFHKNQVQNQQKLENIYVSDQQQFLLFFKHFFSKPYTLCNRPSTRKILQVLWQSVSFRITNSDKLYYQIKLWIYGISIPSNPTLIMLHKVVLKNPQAIPKYAKMIFNDKIYMGINETDPLIKTPLLLAVQIQNKKAIQKLIKCGANPYLSSCYVKKGQYSCEYSQTKFKKHLFTINFPHFNKKILSPMEKLLFFKQDLLSETLYFIQLANIRKLRKQTDRIKQKLKQIPDCTFQVQWKTYRGILSFKQLPSDIITVYKKGSMLRIDYNIDSIQNPVKGKHFTILLKVEQDKHLQFYEIRHHSKTILNKMTQIDMSIIKERLNQFCLYPQARNSQIAQCKGMYENKNENEGKKVRMEMNLTMQNQIITPQLKKNQDLSKPIFKNTTQYEKSIIESQLIDYKAMQKSQIQAVLEQKIVNQKYLPIKLKSKVQKSSMGLQIQFQEQMLNLRQLQFMLQFFKADSVLLTKILKICSIFENEDVFGDININSYLPTFGKINLERDLTFQMQIKNLNYISINDNVFNVEYKVISDMNYEQNMNPQALDSMQQTMLMQQGYSINVSQFLGKKEKLLQLQDKYARDKFERLLDNEFSNGDVSNNILDDLDEDD